MTKHRWWKAAVPLVLWLSIMAIPVPDGLSREAWDYFALFMAVIAGLILEPLPTTAALK